MVKDAFRKFMASISRYNEVVDAYTKASEASPDHAIAYVNWGIEIAQTGDLEAALAKFEQAASISPDRVEPFNNWGVALAKLGRLDEAIEKFKLALEVDPQSV